MLAEDDPFDALGFDADRTSSSTAMSKLTTTTPIATGIHTTFLSEVPRIVVIDECQHLSYVWHQQLRALHDRPDARFALLLAGGANAVRVLRRDQQLSSRVSMQVHFAPLGGQELIDVLNAFHPVLANSSDELLAEIDRKDCRGNLRRWQSFTKLSLALLPRSSSPDRLSPKVVRAVLSLRGES